MDLQINWLRAHWWPCCKMYRIHHPISPLSQATASKNDARKKGNGYQTTTEKVGLLLICQVKQNYLGKSTYLKTIPPI